MSSQVTSRRLKAGDVETAVLEAGRGGRPLMLVHGFTGAKEDFSEAVGPLAERGWHVVAPDLRGHGESDHPDGEDAYALEVFARDLLELAGELGWPSFVLLGHSMGGMIAQVLLLRDSSRVDALVLMDTSHGAPEGLDPALVETGKKLVRTGGLAKLIETQRVMGDPLQSPAHLRLLAERPGYAEFGEAKMLASSPDMWMAMAGEILVTQRDRLADLAAVEVPTLVLVGEQDQFLLGPSRRIAETIPGAVLEVVPDAGHSPQFENPGAWWSTLTAFLDPLADGSRPTGVVDTSAAGRS